MEFPETDSLVGKGIFSYASPEGLSLLPGGASGIPGPGQSPASWGGRPWPHISLENLLSLLLPLWLPSL